MKKWIAGLFASASLGGGVMYGDARINPYEDKGTHYELPVTSDIPQGERVEIAKDRAEMTIKGWNDEYAIKVIPQIPGPTFGADKLIERPFTAAADRPLFSKKMEYRHGDVTAFIEPRDGTENEFDIDFTLHSKPDTNVFTYKIEGAEDFDFFYQPALTEQEIAEGASRPDNVVGSYAVYHKEKANHRIGSTNYATGKAFHIYRPKAIDANGAETWAELSYIEGVLSVTVPQKFLDEAVYPVVIDPTLGHTSVGATQVDLVNLDYLRCTTAQTTDASGGAVSEIQFYSRKRTATNITWQGGIYASSTLALLTPQTSNQTLNSTTAQWWVATFTGPTLDASTAYIVCFFVDGSVASQSFSYFNDSGDSSPRKTGVTFSSWPDPFVPTFLAGRNSIYATYTASGGGGGGTPEEYSIIFD